MLSRPWRENVSHFLRTYLCSTYIYCALLVWAPAQLGSPLHSGSKWLKSAKNDSLEDCDFTIFFNQVSADGHNFRFLSLNVCVCMENLPNCCRHKNDPSFSHLFKIQFLAGFCHLAPLCAALCEAQKNAHQTNFRQGTMHTG